MCPDRQILSAYFDGEVGEPWARQIAEHAAGCPRCSAWLDHLEETRRVLAQDQRMEWRAPMERVRRRILAHQPDGRPRQSIWRRQMTLPVPVAALAAALLLILGISLAVVSTRQNLGFIRITRAPAGDTEYQFAVPYEKVEALLKSVGGTDANIESVMTIPKNVKLVPVGEPRMGRADEFPRKKP